ncbi:Bet_v_1 domain-containing protein [Cephalotus follicularis]|uniref:Bet_v_1 domain-containing protein n=1 Tax=Cephalotus follicularis TaxID=3775 RepID=A0A1Q3B812_CEPFO|nr:Bet_v_1 domain-containing protein [Cephalotus follicularis]
MGVVTYKSEVPSVIPPARLFNAFVLDADDLLIKVAPNAFKSIELIEGDGGPGSIKKTTFHEGLQFNYVKHKIEAIDKENHTYSYSVIEGDALVKGLIEKITNEIEILPSPEGGSILKSTNTYYTVGDVEIKEEQIMASKEKASKLFKGIEAYLLANPDAYN